MFGQIGMQELMVILVIAVIIFGPKRLPEFARGISKGLNEFRRAAQDIRNEITLDEPIDPNQDAAQPKKSQQKNHN